MGEYGLADALAVADPDQFLRLERDAGRNGRFAWIDQLAANLLTMALSGRNLVDITPGERGQKNRDIITVTFLTPQDRALVGETFSLSAQQARGAWFLPEQATLKAGTLNLSAHARHYPWQAVTIAGEDVARVHMGSTADALLAWSLLIPLFDALMAPITIRASGSAQSADEQHKAWTAILQSYTDLGIAPTPEVMVFAYRGGWSQLDRAGQVQARIALLDLLARHDLLQIAARFRASRLQKLIAATMKKTGQGSPLARRVLTKVLQPTLSAYFAGDWLAFLDHIEVPPNSGEELVTALPEPKLYVGGSAKAESAAAQHGLNPDDVHAMLAAFLGQDSSVSPVEQRVDVLKRWWQQFDAIHARQTANMPSLWGLVEEGFYSIGYGEGPQRQLYRTLLSTDLVEDVNRLWDGTTLARWPQVIVSEPYPHRLMAETLGPAVTFWHSVALTTWYVCEGPTSRTSLTGLRAYHKAHLTQLADAETPIHPSLFDELENAERYLGPPQELPSYEHQLKLADGHIGFRVTGGGQRRDGFAILRDIVTRHRQGWTQRYLTHYLQHRWTSELTHVARELHKFIAVNGKSPTFRQFARVAATAANHWFNGDLAGLYTAIGEKAPATPRRVDLLPIAAHDFVDAVYARLGGRPYEELLRVTNFPLADEYRQKARLAAASVLYLQIAEALGRAPDPKEFGAARHEWSWAGSVDEGWLIYQKAIDEVLAHSQHR
ncbi:stress protein [Microbispora sp. H11081]|uniref:stress protein n=1 Tax=Microbispora sp. H11081 TaxID=2729107 RepID=UPI0014742F05|nr:stress protein [Microbispora sp. H11081]